ERKLVFVCAKIPVPGLPLVSQIDSSPALAFAPDLMVTDELGRVRYTDSAAVAFFYHDVPKALVDRSLSELRPQGMKAMTEPSPLVRWPEIPMASVYCTHDQTTPAAYSRIAGQHHGMQVIELPGGHSPFLSRPAALARVLDGLATG